MTTSTRHPSTARTGATPRSAVLAIAVLFAGCNNEPERDEAVPAQPTPPPPSSPSDERVDRSDREQARLAPSEPAPAQSDPQRRAEREPTSQPDASDRTQMGSPSGMQEPPDGQQQRSGLSGPAAQQSMQIVEKSASGDIRGFENRLRRELAADELQLAAAVDLQQQPPMRLLVVAPKPDSEREKQAKTGSAEMDRPDETSPQANRAAPEIETPGQPQTPETVAPTMPPGSDATRGSGEGTTRSQQARTALEQVRVLVAYTEEGETDRVRLSYFEHPRAMQDPTRGEDMTADIDAAIDRAARGPEAAPAG